MAAISPFPLPRSTETGPILITTRANPGTVWSRHNHRRLLQWLESTASGTIIRCSVSHGILPLLISSELIGFSVESIILMFARTHELVRYSRTSIMLMKYFLIK